MIYLSKKFPYEHNKKKWDYLSRVVWDFGRLPGAWQFKKLSISLVWKAWGMHPELHEAITYIKLVMPCV